MRFPLRPAAVAVVALALALAGCTSGSAPVVPPTPQPGSTVAPTPDLGRYYAQRPVWKACRDGFQCTTIQVPLDYSHPDGTAITLALIRLPALDPRHRIGALLVNPGGPGASGVQYAREAARGFDKVVRDAYDIVGFDPRGVGSSTAVHCLSDKQEDALLAYDGSPDTPAEELGIVAISKQFADACEAESGALLPHIGTVDAARDMDVIRAVMGDSVMHYYGASYGTALGATYADEFPSKVGRMVLDGALDPALSAVQLSEGQMGGFVTALNAFLADCVTLSDCPVGHTVSEGLARITALIDNSDQHPLRSKSGRVATQALVVLGVLYPLYDRASGWPALRVALSEANKGNPDVLLSIADQYADRDASGHYTSNELQANTAINCIDRPDHSTIADLRADAVAFSKVSPLLGAYFAWSDVGCTVWPVQSGQVPHALHAVGAAPILVVGTTRDPATPYQWAVNLARELSSGRLLSRDGDGHTGYLRGSTCVDNAVDSYLVTGALPAVGTMCH